MARSRLFHTRSSKRIGPCCIRVRLRLVTVIVDWLAAIVRLGFHTKDPEPNISNQEVELRTCRNCEISIPNQRSRTKDPKDLESNPRFQTLDLPQLRFVWSKPSKWSQTTYSKPKIPNQRFQSNNSKLANFALQSNIPHKKSETLDATLSTCSTYKSSVPSQRFQTSDSTQLRG